MNPALVERVRKELENVPCRRCHLLLMSHKGAPDYMKDCLFDPDYQALAEKVAPLVEALEKIEREWGTYDDNSPLVAHAALAPWRTDAPSHRHANCPTGGCDVGPAPGLRCGECGHVGILKTDAP